MFEERDEELKKTRNSKRRGARRHRPLSRSSENLRNNKTFVFGACNSAFRLLLLLARLLLLQNLLDDLLLLDQEGADNAVADAVAASGTTVGALDGLLGLGDLGVLAGAESGKLMREVSQSAPVVMEQIGPRPRQGLQQQRLASGCSTATIERVRSLFDSEFAGCWAPRPSSIVLILPFASGSTYARELGAAVTALGGGAALLDVQKTELATGGLNNSRPVGASVVAKGSRRSAEELRQQPHHDNSSIAIRFVARYRW